jgi:nucleoside 2-deoxyribosyltransferase
VRSSRHVIASLDAAAPDVVATAFELGYAKGLGKYVVAIDPAAAPALVPLRAAANVTVATTDAAIDVLESVLELG